MNSLLVALIAAIVKVLGQDVVTGVLQALNDAEVRADAVSLGQQQQKAADQAQATADANATAKTVAAEAQAEADSPKTEAGIDARLEDGTA